MNWLLLVVYYGVSSNVFTTGPGMSLESVHATRDECQAALEAYAHKSGATDLTLVCVEGERFKPVPQRVKPKTEK